VRSFDRALKKDPESVSALAGRSSAFAALRHCDRALADLDRAIVLSPDLAELYILRAQVFRQLENREGAIANYAQAISLQPDDPNPYLERARLLLPEEPDAALADLNRCLEIRSDYIPAYEIRRNVYRLLGRFAEADADDQYYARECLLRHL
jgi:tetratricopeptide (TPR) repeat protein